MTERENVPPGAPCWIDLWTSDVDASRRFYAGLFGWEAQEPSVEFGGYFMFTRHGVPVAGAMGDMGDTPADNTWKVYLTTSDINETVAAGVSAGANFTFPPMPVADLGIQTVLNDSTGAALGAWQPIEFPGFMTLEEPGTPCWFELNARDYDAAVDFYQRVFHLEPKVMADSDDFRYASLVSGDSEVAGILDARGLLGDGVTSNWVVYWQVDDISQSLSLVSTLGGRVIDGPVDSPYGPIATVCDPSGAVFKLRSSPPA
jgi:predicted enzyme related to lactoylglutathione lyase